MVDFSKLFGVDELSKPKFYVQAANECLGSLFWFVLASQADNAWITGISFILVQACMGGDCHLWSPWTVFRIIQNKHMNPLKGLFWLIMQALGVFLGGLLAGALELEAANYASMTWDLKEGFAFFIALSFALHAIDLANGDKDTGIQRSFMIIFVFAILSWFGAASANFSWEFAAFDAQFYVRFVWTILAAGFYWVKKEYLLN